MTTELNEALTKLAEKLGTSVEKIYSVLTKQAKIEAILSVVYLVFILLAAFILFRTWEWIIPFCKPENPKPDYTWDTDWPVAIQIGVAFLFVASIVILVLFIQWLSGSLSKIITAIYNPEAAAIEKILEVIK